MFEETEDEKIFLMNFVKNSFLLTSLWMQVMLFLKKCWLLLCSRLEIIFIARPLALTVEAVNTDSVATNRSLSIQNSVVVSRQFHLTATITVTVLWRPLHFSSSVQHFGGKNKYIFYIVCVLEDRTTAITVHITE